jgi:hypothetical protein
LHALLEFGSEITMASFEEETNVANCAAISVVGGQAWSAGTKTAMDVVLQAGVGVFAIEIELAGGDLEVSVDEVHQAMG